MCIPVFQSASRLQFSFAMRDPGIMGKKTYLALLSTQTIAGQTQKCSLSTPYFLYSNVRKRQWVPAPQKARNPRCEKNINFILFHFKEGKPIRKTRKKQPLKNHCDCLTVKRLRCVGGKKQLFDHYTARPLASKRKKKKKQSYITSTTVLRTYNNSKRKKTEFYIRGINVGFRYANIREDCFLFFSAARTFSQFPIETLNRDAIKYYVSKGVVSKKGIGFIKKANQVYLGALCCSS